MDDIIFSATVYRRFLVKVSKEDYSKVINPEFWFPLKEDIGCVKLVTETEFQKIPALNNYRNGIT